MLKKAKKAARFKDLMLDTFHGGVPMLCVVDTFNKEDVVCEVQGLIDFELKDAPKGFQKSRSHTQRHKTRFEYYARQKIKTFSFMGS